MSTIPEGISCWKRAVCLPVGSVVHLKYPDHHVEARDVETRCVQSKDGTTFTGQHKKSRPGPGPTARDVNSHMLGQIGVRLAVVCSLRSLVRSVRCQIPSS